MASSERGQEQDEAEGAGGLDISPGLARSEEPAMTTPPPPLPPSRDPLHGITLERIVQELVDHFGWEGLGERVRLRALLH
jgi:hypothetical protein